MDKTELNKILNGPKPVQLRGANLTGAYLTGAVLRGADLTGAYLRDANLTGVNLTGAKICLNSHDLISLILLRAAEQDPALRKIAGMVLVSPDWCWETWAEVLTSVEISWCLTALSPYLSDLDPKTFPQPLKNVMGLV